MATFEPAPFLMFRPFRQKFAHENENRSEIFSLRFLHSMNMIKRRHRTEPRFSYKKRKAASARPPFSLSNMLFQKVFGVFVFQTVRFGDRLIGDIAVQRVHAPEQGGIFQAGAHIAF